jgi:hypothetical protein
MEPTKAAIMEDAQFSCKPRIQRLSTLPGLNYPGIGPGCDVSLITVTAGVELPGDMSDEYYRQNIHHLTRSFGTRDRYQSLLASLRWERADSVTGVQDANDYNVHRHLMAVDVKQEHCGRARGIRPDDMGKIITGIRADAYDLFSAEGQLIRCLLAESSNSKRLDIVYNWAVVAWRLFGSATVLSDFTAAVQAVADISDLSTSCCQYGPRSMFTAHIHMSKTVLELQSRWIDVMATICGLRDLYWKGACFDIELCPIHGASCVYAAFGYEEELEPEHIKPIGWKKQNGVVQRKPRSISQK